MEFQNVTKGANDGQGIGTTPDGTSFNIPGVKLIVVRPNEVIAIVDNTGAVHEVDFNNPALNKFLTSTPQALVDHWFNENFFSKPGGSGTGQPTNFNVDTDIVQTIDNTATLTKQFSQLLSVHKNGVYISLNRVTYVHPTLTFLDGAVTGQTVEVLGIETV